MLFSKKLLCSSIAMAMAVPAFVQAEDPVVEEVIVTGVRGSLTRAMDLKRESSGVVDSINSEDIGKMSDTNLAESLQRITGVSIDRSDGEGNKVTVRGLGPDFNLVTLNGRALARTSGSRSFDFANIASEIVSGVTVEKTGNAANFSGGMGATIDLKTQKPLDSSGRKVIFSVKAIEDKSTDEGSVTPELVGLYSDTFADDTIGVSVALTYQERENGNTSAEVGTGWRSFDGTQDQDWSGAPGANPAWGGVPKDGQVNRPTSADEFYSVPQTIVYKFTEQQRKRLNGQLVLQWRPIDSLTATLDYNRFERTVESQFQDVSSWFIFAPSSNVFNEAPVATPIIYSENYSGVGGAGPQDFSMGASDTAEKWTTDAFGLNLEWLVNDRLSLALDIAVSEADRTPDHQFGSSNVIATAAFIRTSTSGDFTTDIPTLIVGGGNDVQPSDMQVTGSQFTNSEDRETLDQYQFDGKFEFDEQHSIDFGVEYTEINNEAKSVTVQRNDWGGVGAPGDLDEDIFERMTLQDRFDGSFGDFSEQLAGGNTLADGTVLGPEDVLNTYFQINFNALRAQAEELYTPANLSATVIGDCGSLFCPSTDFSADTDRTTKETTTGAYLQYSFAPEYGLNAQLGLRYEETEVDSAAIVPTFNGAVWIADTEIELQPAGREALSDSGKYHEWLPNLNLSYRFTDRLEGLLARFSASKTIARPNEDDLKGGTVVGTLANRAGGSGSAGNPGLLPFKSTNFDLSLEYYYGDASYVSVGYFEKTVENFIATSVDKRNAFGLFNPSSGPKVDAAIAVVGNDAGAIRDYIFANFANSPEVDVATGRITATSADDPMIFDINVPSNGGQDQDLDGIEVAWQHMYGESGFGTVVNFTLVSTDNEYSNTFTDETGTLADQEAIIGVSDSANLVVFYENYNWNVRLAYNWRDEFLNSRFQGTGPNPQYTDEFQQLDMNISYEFSEEGQVFLQALNITDEETRTFGRDDRQTLNYNETGRRWIVGVRYSF